MRKLAAILEKLRIEGHLELVEGLLLFVEIDFVIVRDEILFGAHGSLAVGGPLGKVRDVERLLFGFLHQINYRMAKMPLIYNVISVCCE